MSFTLTDTVLSAVIVDTTIRPANTAPAMAAVFFALRFRCFFFSAKTATGLRILCSRISGSSVVSLSVVTRNCVPQYSQVTSSSPLFRLISAPHTGHLRGINWTVSGLSLLVSFFECEPCGMIFLRNSSAAAAALFLTSSKFIPIPPAIHTGFSPARAKRPSFCLYYISERRDVLMTLDFCI